MTFPEIAGAAADRAVVFLGAWCDRTHGPHLPLGTDVYMPIALLRHIRELLRGRGVAAW